MKQKSIKEIMSDMWGHFGELIESQNSLYEGLITTYPIDKTIEHLELTFGDEIRVVFDEKTGKILTYFPFNFNSEKLIKEMDMYGWFKSFPKNDNDIKTIKNTKNEMFYVFEPKFDIDVTDDVNYLRLDKQGKEPMFKQLFHLTPVAYLDKIRSKGLQPKSDSKMTYHPERLYFLTNLFPEEHIPNFINKLYSTNIKNIENKDKYALLEIFLKPNETTGYGFNLPKTKFYRDPNFLGGIYTLEPINPKDIVIKSIYTIKSTNPLKFDVEKINQKLIV